MSAPVEKRKVGRVVDAFLALLVAGGTFAATFHDEPSTMILAGVGILAIVAGIALWFRRRYPLVVLSVMLAVALGARVMGTVAVMPLMVGAEVALFTVSSLISRRVAIVAGVITGCVAFAIARESTPGEAWWSPESLGVVVWTAFAVAVGDAVRTRRIYVEVLEDRAWRAEETREQEARARVTEERVRIARELHDIVAHHIAVINIQAGLAERAITRSSPEVASKALGHVREAARSALADLSAVLRLLRSPDDQESQNPPPGLPQVNDLVRTLSNQDSDIHTTIRGEVQQLDTVCDLTAYRVIQEALTNATKHGVPGRTRLVISYEAAGLVVTVTNPVRTDLEGTTVPVVAGTGHGVLGLRERVASVGGTITAQQLGDGTFAVMANIPYHPERPDTEGGHHDSSVDRGRSTTHSGGTSRSSGA